MVSRHILSWLLVLLGSGLVILALLSYSVIASEDTLLTPQRIRYVENLGYATFVFTIIGVIATGFGAVRLLSARTAVTPRLVDPFSTVLTRKRYWALGLFSSILYAILFCLVSGIIVYQPSLAFSHEYGVAIPSISIATCCGTFGQFPELVAYVSENLGFVISPLNLIILFSVSFLVGLNAGIAMLAWDTRILNAYRGWIGISGATLGLFTSCPTCAGLFLSTLAGVSGALSVTLGAWWLRGLLVLAGLSGLITAPLATAGRLTSTQNCQIQKRGKGSSQTSVTSS